MHDYFHWIGRKRTVRHVPAPQPPREDDSPVPNYPLRSPGWICFGSRYSLIVMLGAYLLEKVVSSEHLPIPRTDAMVSGQRAVLSVGLFASSHARIGWVLGANNFTSTLPTHGGVRAMLTG